jgi:hypothetical protein
VKIDVRRGRGGAGNPKRRLAYYVIPSVGMNIEPHKQGGGLKNADSEAKAVTDEHAVISNQGAAAC